MCCQGAVIKLALSRRRDNHDTLPPQPLMRSRRTAARDTGAGDREALATKYGVQGHALGAAAFLAARRTRSRRRRCALERALRVEAQPTKTSNALSAVAA